MEGCVVLGLLLQWLFVYEQPPRARDLGQHVTDAHYEVASTTYYEYIRYVRR